MRWVLRYAAIPRRFDYEFVRDVLWPHIREEMGGIRSRDNPAADQRLVLDRPGQTGYGRTSVAGGGGPPLA